MGFMDKIKGLFKGREQQVKTGVDQGADAAKKVVPDQHDAKADQAAEKAKDAVDDLSKDEGGAASTTP